MKHLNVSPAQNGYVVTVFRQGEPAETHIAETVEQVLAIVAKVLAGSMAVAE